MRVFWLSVAVVLSLAGCANLGVDEVYQSPTFQHQGSQLTALSWQQLDGRSRVIIDNPNAYSLPIQSLSAELWLNGEPWLQLDSPPISGLPAGRSTTVDLDWSLAVSGVFDRVANAYENGEVELTLHLSPTVNVPVLGSRQLQWQQAFAVPVPRLPKVQLADWRVDSINLTSVTLELDLLLDNPNRFGLSTGPVELAVRQGSTPMSAVSLSPVSMGAGEKRMQSTRLRLDYGDLGSTLISALRDGTWPSNLQLQWSAPVRSPDLGLDLPDFVGEVAL
ncbi:LEA type 2 family protein [Saccharospirillum sp. HFRX-1]|uniref:LEA type 2 family protein n=1 Tax=unclassified Saccharospirillum TaxID=2633430 RepID=UPI00371011D1